jgi:hypothetical protein
MRLQKLVGAKRRYRLVGLLRFYDFIRRGGGSRRLYVCGVHSLVRGALPSD